MNYKTSTNNNIPIVEVGMSVGMRCSFSIHVRTFWDSYHNHVAYHCLIFHGDTQEV